MSHFNNFESTCAFNIVRKLKRPIWFRHTLAVSGQRLYNVNERAFYFFHMTALRKNRENDFQFITWGSVSLEGYKLCVYCR